MILDYFEDYLKIYAYHKYLGFHSPVDLKNFIQLNKSLFIRALLKEMIISSNYPKVLF